MDVLEDITVRHHDAYFVDLFVRSSNKLAIQMYTKVRSGSRERLSAQLLQPLPVHRPCQFRGSHPLTHVGRLSQLLLPYPGKAPGSVDVL